ncbi:MAG: transglycosylase SLT domain-containing protein [Nitrospiraceae bacterium]
MTQAVPPVRVRVQRGLDWTAEQVFTVAFRIGRLPECEVHIPDPIVSKVHAQVTYEQGRWWLYDAQSLNGTFLNGERIDRVALPATGKVGLGVDGATLWITVGEGERETGRSQEISSAVGQPESVTVLVKMLEGRTETGNEAGHKKYREAVQRIKTKQARRYSILIGLCMVLLVGTGLYAYRQYLRIEAIREQAGDIFYAMKQVELRIAELEGKIEYLEEKTRQEQLKDIVAKRQLIKSLEAKYDRFIKELGIYDPSMSEQERAVFHVARLFGECEATMPKDFLREVNKYIRRWKATDRLSASIRRAKENGYIDVVANQMFTRNLPPQFFYLALQESGFDSKAVGPKTRLGYAKGIWQFIPTTAQEYGLKTGPLKDSADYDPKDERFHFVKATEAAARYIKRIYTTDAQASGLLVIASYNWGEGNVIKMIRQLPQNPQERNFWKLLQNFKIPKETYDYVFSIIAAAVIGENPRLFGFDFGNPFAPSSP